MLITSASTLYFHCAYITEWTFAKQKWQRTKGVVRGDPKHETAEILPGWNEKIYG